MNITALIGNLASEPELRKTGTGRAVCNFRIAVSRTNGDGADFFTVVAWERQAEFCATYLNKGRRIGVEGRLHHSTWDVQEGDTTHKRSRVEIVASRVQLLGAPRTPAPIASSPEHQAETDTGDFSSVAASSFVEGADREVQLAGVGP